MRSWRISRISNYITQSNTSTPCASSPSNPPVPPLFIIPLPGRASIRILAAFSRCFYCVRHLVKLTLKRSEKLPGNKKPILVGGSAVEFYTCEQAQVLAGVYWDKLDIEYLRERMKEEDLEIELLKIDAETLNWMP